jgi:hypothetical protein
MLWRGLFTLLVSIVRRNHVEISSGQCRQSVPFPGSSSTFGDISI